MVAAVAQLAVVHLGALVPFPGFLLDALDLFSFLLGSLYPFLDDRSDVHVHPEIVVQVLGDEIVDECPDGLSAVDDEGSVRILHRVTVFHADLFPHVGGTKFGLGLALEVGLLNLDAYGSDDTSAAVFRSIVFLEEFLEGFCDRLAESCKVGASVSRVLAVDKGSDVLAIVVVMGNHDLDVVVFQMDGRVQGSFSDSVVHEVQEAVLGLVVGPVQFEGEALVEVGIVLDHGFDEIHVELDPRTSRCLAGTRQGFRSFPSRLLSSRCPAGCPSHSGPMNSPRRGRIQRRRMRTGR